MLFSIIITCHDQREFIADAVSSALLLRAQDVEIIVVDDASTDGSQIILGRYGNETRLLFLEKNLGACAARNRGASLATGRYLVFLDGDDALLPWALDVYRNIALTKSPAMILASMRWFRRALPAVDPGETPQAMRLVEYLDYMSKDRPFGNSASALVIDRQCFQAVGGWPEELFPLEDQDLVIRLGDSGKTVQVLSPATILHRAHPGNTVNSVAPFLHSLRQIIRRERMGRYPGGKERRLERYGLLGGLVFFWAKRAVKCGLCAEALKLVAHGWQMALVGATRRVQAVLRGQRPCEALAVAVSTLARETPLGAASKL